MLQRKQTQFVHETWGRGYPRRGWGVPLLWGFGIVFGFYLVVFLVVTSLR